MKVTVCELSNEPDPLLADWNALVSHVNSEASDLVLLPEMPFHPWVAQTNHVDTALWQASVEAHDKWMGRLSELSPAGVISSRPVTRHGKRFNEGFIWDPESGYRAVHTKYYLPNEAGFWEASWYERGENTFTPTQNRQAKIGFLICTEIWFTEHARKYAKQGIHLLACPRASPKPSTDKWMAGGRVAAVMSGAFCLSSNFSFSDNRRIEWGGNGWIIDPEEGDILGLTSPERSFLTVEIDLKAAEAAKNSYPRYVLE